MSCGRQQERRKNLPAKQQINVWPGSSSLSCDADRRRHRSHRRSLSGGVLIECAIKTRPESRLRRQRTHVQPAGRSRARETIGRRRQSIASLRLKTTCPRPHTREEYCRGDEETLARVLASGECSPPQVSSPPWQRLNGDLSPFSCHG